MALSWHTTRHFPSRLHVHKTPGTHDALVGIGGNLGDVPARFERLYRYWQRSGVVQIVETSPILRNPPFGYADQPDFDNAVVHLRTALDPHAFLRYLLYVEKRFGRERSFANAPRTLDLDLIFYDHRHIQSPRLRLPHPHWHERDSVVMPLFTLKGYPW